VYLLKRKEDSEVKYLPVLVADVNTNADRELGFFLFVFVFFKAKASQTLKAVSL